MKVIFVVLAVVAAAQAGFINGGHGGVIDQGVGFDHGVGVIPSFYSGGHGGFGYGNGGFGYGNGGFGYGHSVYHAAPVHHAYAVPAISHYSAPIHYGVGHTKVIGFDHGVHGYNAGWLKKK